jgi:thioesterase domain-containing protein
VAFEVARQLVARGEQVALLAVVDALRRPPLLAPFLGPWAYLVGAIPGMEDASAPGLRRLLPAFQWFLSMLLRRLRLAGLVRRVRGRPSKGDDPLVRFVVRLIEAHRRGTRRYRFRPYPGPITYFWAEDTRLPALRDPRLGWETLARGGFTCIRVPGAHHLALAEPHVAVLADKLLACLAEVQEDAGAVGPGP